MSNDIPLPQFNINTKGSAHPYPHQIGIQCQRLMQGVNFYYMFLDCATGLYVRSTKEAYSSVKEQFLEVGISESDWELGWHCMDEYTDIFHNPLLYNAVLSMVSNWDWFASNLGKFLVFSIPKTSVVQVTEKQLRELDKLHAMPFNKQLLLLDVVLRDDLPIDQSIIESANDLFLARNLGVHNNWIVDIVFLSKTKMKNCGLGQILQIDSYQLGVWRKSIGEIINIISSKIALAFVSAPDYP